MHEAFDVLVIGGGPGGATCGAFLKKYRPELRVAIVERERFPRDHIGESQLPVIGAILDELGIWDKVEAADFPIKIGATYRWGATPSTWNFEFLPNGNFVEEPRPGRYQGQRVRTAFQVDRSIYDKILLDHAREMGCEIYERHRATPATVREDRVSHVKVEGLQLTGDVSARWFVDASGASGLLRRALGIKVEAPTTLRNIAVWDYWQNAEWASTVGVGGTRILVLSVGYGWLWFIPISPTRTSIGLVVPASYFKQSKSSPRELLHRAIAEEPRLRKLTQFAMSEEKLQTTNDWSFVADRMASENWFLVGDSCGFADPILSAGMTLAHTSAREVAFSILELDRARLDPNWIRAAYDANQRLRIRQHIRFADYWYSANGQFSELIDYTSEIAKGVGLNLSPDEAFLWLGTGGFAADALGHAAVGAFSVAAIKQIAVLFTDKAATWKINNYNIYRLNLANSKREKAPIYREGQVDQARVFARDGKRLVLTGAFKTVFEALKIESDLQRIVDLLTRYMIQEKIGLGYMQLCMQALEVMTVEGWVDASVDPSRPCGDAMTTAKESATFQFERT